MNATRLFAVSLLALPFVSAPAQKLEGRTPVLVELFTSEGCSSCPPADALLAKLESEQPFPGAEIIVLGEHVDYWDSLGWRDRFSSHQYTDRQGQYSTHFHLNDVYTPQMVVNGQTQFVGNDTQAASRAIVHAAQAKALPLVLTGARVNGKRLSASVDLASPASGARGDLYAALVSPMESTQVRAGENGGRTLHHAGVVRSLTKIGNLQALQRGPVSFDVQLVDAGRPHASRPLRPDRRLRHDSWRGLDRRSQLIVGNSRRERKALSRCIGLPSKASRIQAQHELRGKPDRCAGESLRGRNEGDRGGYPRVRRSGGRSHRPCARRAGRDHCPDHGTSKAAGR